jgi:hypothetical protein
VRLELELDVTWDPVREDPRFQALAVMQQGRVVALDATLALSAAALGPATSCR